MAKRIALLLALGLATETHSAVPPPHGLLFELQREIGGMRRVGPMLTISPVYAKCSSLPDTLGIIPRNSCPTSNLSRRTRERIAGIATRASAVAQRSADPDALHALALIDLLFARGEGNALNRSISNMQKAARLSEAPERPLADLAAALLIRAEQTQSSQDLFQAVEMAGKALQHDSRHPAALFNLALSLELLGIDGEADVAWRRFQTWGRGSKWKGEGERRRRAREHVRPLRAPFLGAPATAFAQYVAGAPREAREWGWWRLLGGWGAAHLRGDSAGAAAYLRAAELMGTALEQQGGDATLVDAVRSIRGCPPGKLDVLARGHHMWAEGLAKFEQEHGAPREHFARLLRLGAPSAALDLWARHYYGATLVVTGSLQAGAVVLQQLLADADSIRAPALRGNALAVLGTAHLRDASYQEAQQTAHRALAAFQQAGEAESQGRALYLMSDAEFSLGLHPDAYASAHRALKVLRPFRGSHWLHTALSVTGEELASDALPIAARHFYDEDVAVASRHPNATYYAEALVYRAQFRAAVQDLTGAVADYEAGDSLIRQFPPGQRRMWFTGDALAARAATLLKRDPGRAARLLDSVIALPDSAQTVMRQLNALVARAEARLGQADASGAAADLERATTLLRQQHDRIASEPYRASLLDAARSVFDRVVMLHVNRGQPVDALRVLERGRASLAPVRGPGPAGRTELRAPPGETVLEYALIGDTLLTWAIRWDSVRFVRTDADRDGLLRDAERARTLLEAGGSDEALLPLLGTLHDRLVRPFAAALGPRDARVVLIADGELGAVPFAALYDARRRRYLIHDHVLRYAANLQEAFPQPRRASVAALNALLAAGPASVPGLPELQPLVANGHEVRSVSIFYSGAAEVMAGSGATAPAVTRALSGAWLFHFAGHALLDDARPEQSSLVLSAAAGSPSGRLTAEDLGALDLRHMRLVVLSACETLRSRDGRSGGLAGFSGALLAAGAGGVIGSTWRVNDRPTRELMVRFHDSFSRSRDAPAALREAQLQLLRSPDPSLRSPSAWAGFRYAGN
ncbi:MAG TPA: CHAT domain-containing protein [Longimicrobium sp.]|jgi:CHAT domain-containing protein|uniref:CHAT domain-containing protein n=1 Tax=Longimicrobium sp. TaxID=2029185 RepID=UPI002EDB68B9